MNDRPLLALETSVPTARVAVLGPDGTVLAQAEKAAARHSSNLLPLCDEALRAAGAHVGDLAGIACGAGPGSFTGLRVGLAVAKGLALPFGTPLLLVSSLEALARDLEGPAGVLVVPCLDAGKDQVYARFFGAETGTEDWVLDPAELLARVSQRRPVVVGGTGADRYRALFVAALGEAAVCAQVPGPSALSVGLLALQRLRRGETDDLERAVPSYGRPPDITAPKRNRL